MERDSPPGRMVAMRLTRPRAPLERLEVEVPRPGPGEVLLEVRACGVCRTDLHLVDGELEGALTPITPGHEIVGRVVARGEGAERFALGERLGVPWLGATCGRCAFCATDRENLCDSPRFTGFSRDGGYARYVAADERFALALPQAYSDAEAAT
jgi:propanol-preferring alcohol dehydrogenase